MIVLITGQVGLRKGEYLHKLKEIANRKNRNVEVAPVGPTMLSKYEGKIDEKTILNLPKVLLDLLRRFAWSDILNKSKSIKMEDIFIVNSHAVFRWHHGLFPAIDLDLLIKLSPHIVFTLIDDIDIVSQELERRRTPFFELWELIAWREEEVWITKFLVDSLNKLNDGQNIRFFLIPKALGPELMFRILTEPYTPKVYLSFPVTGLPADKVREIKTFKIKAMKNFIAFDPLKLKEREIVNTAMYLSPEINELLQPIKKCVENLQTEIKNINRRWNLFWDEWSSLALSEIDLKNISLKGRDIISVRAAIDSQIISRDYLLIDQSDFVLIYIPMVSVKEKDSEAIRPYISAGSQSEMIYAYAQGKPVYAICEAGEKYLSPWITQYSEVFETLKLAFDFLLDKYIKNKKGGKS